MLWSYSPQVIRYTFASKLDAALLREFPSRKDFSHMTVAERARLYSAVSEVVS